MSRLLLVLVLLGGCSNGQLLNLASDISAPNLLFSNSTSHGPPSNATQLGFNAPCVDVFTRATECTERASVSTYKYKRCEFMNNNIRNCVWRLMDVVPTRIGDTALLVHTDLHTEVAGVLYCYDIKYYHEEKKSWSRTWGAENGKSLCSRVVQQVSDGVWRRDQTVGPSI